MFKRLLPLLLILALSVPALAEGCRVVDTPVFRQTLTDETLSLRYYDDHPSVPCLGLSQYPALFLGTPLDVENRGDGSYIFTAQGGAQAVVDVNAGTLSCADFPAFTNLMGAMVPGMDNQYLDAVSFARPDGLACADPNPVTLDLSAYHIPLHGEAEDVYLPLATLSDIFSNLAYFYVSFNGERVYVSFDNRMAQAWERDPAYAKPIYTRAERPADLAAFAYDELCFAIDTFYGFPGREPIHDDLLALGLDQALLTHSDRSRRCRELLKSEKLGEYAVGSLHLGELLMDGGHTGMDFTALFTDKEEYPDFAVDYYMAVESDPPDYAAYTLFREQSAQIKLRQKKRRDAWGTEHYAEQGDTAVIWFDSFMYDFDGWEAFYAGKGPRPEGDMMRHVIDGLDRAARNPDIKNVVLDVSCNNGGSADMVVALLSLMANVSDFDAENRLMGRIATHKYRVDRNFDGVFDASDADVHYPFRFGVLTSQLSFSCANLLPSRMRDLGMAVLGETSGGGTCAVSMFATPEGFPYHLSFGLARLTDRFGRSIDAGVTPDVALPDGQFYDLAALSDAMNAFYR